MKFVFLLTVLMIISTINLVLKYYMSKYNQTSLRVMLCKQSGKVSTMNILSLPYGAENYKVDITPRDIILNESHLAENYIGAGVQIYHIVTDATDTCE